MATRGRQKPHTPVGVHWSGNNSGAQRTVIVCDACLHSAAGVNATMRLAGFVSVHHSTGLHCDHDVMCVSVNAKAFTINMQTDGPNLNNGSCLLTMEREKQLYKNRKGQGGDVCPLSTHAALSADTVLFHL